MGSCMSCSGSSFSPSSVETIESSLDTGDLVWLAGKGTPKFMFKAGTWRMFSRVGVLVRNGPGIEGLQLCVSQACLQESSEMTQLASDDYITIGSLADELSSGLYKQVAITRLATPLSEAERAQAFSFCNGAIGEQLNQKVPLCVNPSKRVFCNQLAADMLVSCGRVALVDNLYGPAKAVAGQLLQPPIFISVASRSQAYQRNKTAYRTPITSFATDKGNGSPTERSYRDVNDQQEMFYSVHSLPSAEYPNGDVALRSASGSDHSAQPAPGSFGPLAAALATKPGGSSPAAHHNAAGQLPGRAAGGIRA